MQQDEPTGPSRPHITPAVLRDLREAHAVLFGFLRRRLGSQEEAEDVMQQLYVRVMTRAGQIRREESVRVWLRRVLRSLLADHLRRTAARHRAEADFARKEAATPIPDEDIDKVVCLCLYRILPVLRPEYAEVIRRADLQGEPRQQLASALGLSVSSLAVRLHRARRALRRGLEATCETCPIHGYLDCGCDYMHKLRIGHGPTA